MKKLLAFLRARIIFGIPAGQQGVDPTGANGLIGLMSNVNNYSENLSSVASSGTSMTLIALSANVPNQAGNVLSGFVMLNPGATGALNVNLPSTAAMIAALGASIPQDGTYSEPIHVMNNSGQTATLVAADSMTSLLGSAVIAVGNVRKMMLRVLNSSNISITNVGTWTF